MWQCCASPLTVYGFETAIKVGIIAPIINITCCASPLTVYGFETNAYSTYRRNASSKVAPPLLPFTVLKHIWQKCGILING